MMACSTQSGMLGKGNITHALKAIELMQPLETAVQYLGIEDGESFSPSSINADVLVIQFFSMYCPACQTDAAAVNEFYDLTTKPHTGQNIKMIGIGFANSEFEVAIFKRKFNVLFPLFPDPYGDAARALHAYSTPHFVVIQRTDNDNFKLIYEQAGALRNSEKFLKTILTHIE
ncbi:MAG: TlpA family protein disulfide reductase [Candidatus Omnitrophica bacterium]|nr:TlpA family protein disulfide reductase [Candidatus Omnitrophota bacterium]